MARMLHTLTLTASPPVTRTAHFLSRNREFTSPHLIAGNRCFSGIISNRLLPQKLHSANGRLTIRNRATSDQENGSLDHLLQVASEGNFWEFLKALLNFAAKNVLSVALVGAIAFAIANPTPGCVAYRYNVSTFCVFGLFFMSGLTMSNEEIVKAAKAWPIVVFGLTSILLFTPLLSRIMVRLPLQPQEFAPGLALYNCMPTAISSVVALTWIARGNSALALVITVTSRLLGVLIVPFSISKLIVGGVDASVPAGPMFRNLLVTVLILLILGKASMKSNARSSTRRPASDSNRELIYILAAAILLSLIPWTQVLIPLILGKVVREYFAGAAIDSNRELISILDAILLSLIPWTQVSISRPLLLSVKPALVLVAVVMGALLHLVLLGFNKYSIKILCFLLSGPYGTSSNFCEEENYRTLLLVTSQKSVSLLVAVVYQLGFTFGASGLLVLPCIAAYLSQVVIDSFIVDYWKKKEVGEETVEPQKLVEPNQVNDLFLWSLLLGIYTAFKRTLYKK